MAPITVDGKEQQMETHVLGSLQTISYSTHQDRAPVRAIGNINAIDYVQGQRTIAGTMVFAMFHEHWMTPLLKELAHHVDNTDIWSDELPALNLTITMANEYGYKSNMAIYGVKFIDDGGVMSINDLYTENTLQYVATGIQPLKTSGQHLHSYNIKKPEFIINNATPEKLLSSIKNYDKIWDKPIDKEPEEHSFLIPEIKDPIINIFDPITEEDDTIINIYFPELDDTITNVFIKDENDKIYDTEFSPSNNNWIVEVPNGDYTVVVVDKNNNIHEVSDLIVNKPNKDDKTKNTNLPIIIEVGHTSVKALSNNPTHSHATIVKMYSGNLDNDFESVETDEASTYEIAKHSYIDQTSSKEFYIENLDPDTKYKMYTYDNLTKECSGCVTFKTFSYQQEGNDLLLDYVRSNIDLLVTELKNPEYKLDTFRFNNLIDSLLTLEDSDEKTELLLFATKLQNELNMSFNSSDNTGKLRKDNTKPLLNKFITEDEVSDMVIYEHKNNKNYYVAKVKPSTDFEYDGKPNTRYFVQPILDNNEKSVYNDFVCFSDDQKRLLRSYNKVIKLSDLSFINYDSRYNNFNNELKSAIKAANNLNINRLLFPCPWCRVINEVLVADVNFSDYSNNKYYLCIATPEDAINYTPKRKIKINNVNKEIYVDKYYTGIVKDSYYLVWIQDEQCNNISEPFILSTYSNDIDIHSYYNIKYSDHLKNIKSSMSKNSVYKTHIDNAIANMLCDDEDYNYKDLNYKVIQTILSLYESQVSPYVLDDIVMGVLRTFSKSKLETTVICQNGYISFTNNNSNQSISCVYITNEGITKYNVLDQYPISNYENREGYTLLSLVNNYNSNRSGYVLINNKTKEVYTSNIRLEMIK